MTFVSLLLARRSAALRHGVWTLTIGTLLALPLVQAIAPPLRVPLPFANGPEEETIGGVVETTPIAVVPRADAARLPAPSSNGGAVSRSIAA